MVQAACSPDGHLLRQAVHRSPLLTRKGLLERLFTFWFDSFVYNQIWEDPRVDLEALELGPASRVVTIASGGCNVLNYLGSQPESIAAVDINRYHIYLTRLKLAALGALPGYEDFYAFFGHADSTENLARYRTHVRERLDPETREFWEGGTWLRRHVIGPRIHYFKDNLYNYAKLGYLLRFVHALCRVTRKHPWRILDARSREEQQRLFDETIAPFFDNRMVKLIGRQPLVLFSLGIPPKQLEALQAEMEGDIVDLYRERVRRLTCEFPIADNYFTWQALSRRYDHANRQALPEYLKPEGYSVRRELVSRVHTEVAGMTEFLSRQPDASHDRYVLLDSQDWMEPRQIEALWAQIARTGRPGTRVIFRTGSSRSPLDAALPAALRRCFVYEAERSSALFKRDRAAIYGGFHLYTKPG